MTVLVLRDMTMVVVMTVVSAMAMMVRPSLCRCCACTKHCRCHDEFPKHEGPRFGKGIAPPSELKSAESGSD